MKRPVPISVPIVVVLAVVTAGLASAAPAKLVANKQRIALEVKVPLTANTGKFVLVTLTSGPLKVDFGSIAITTGPTPVFRGRIIHGQSVDRFRGTDKLKGMHGTLVISLQVDFASAGNGYQVGTGTWAIVSGTNVYAGLTGGGRSAFMRPPVPPGRFGFAEHEGFVTTP